MSSLSERLKYLRIDNNITQKELAKQIGISERGIIRYEIGERNPTIEIIIAIADFFDVSLDYLVGRSDDPKRY